MVLYISRKYLDILEVMLEKGLARTTNPEKPLIYVFIALVRTRAINWFARVWNGVWNVPIFTSVCVPFLLVQAKGNNFTSDAFFSRPCQNVLPGTPWIRQVVNRTKLCFKFKLQMLTNSIIILDDSTRILAHWTNALDD